ncbi:MAG: adenylyl-sulfate kinase [Candidatus Aureabacteria bacterium]|nr:adenylyl-sulfate kinase [Candidatus Auribacterota bacterium]
MAYQKEENLQSSVCNSHKFESKGFTVWFIGLSGSGKTTIAQILYRRLKKENYKVEMLDDDIIRTNLSKGLGFSKEDRDENIKRVGFVCEVLTRNGVIALSVCISPYKEARELNRKRIGSFVEVYTKCTIEECIKRDPKGNYKKALAGEIKNYTGIDDPYEEPVNPEIILETDKETPEQSAEKLLNKLKELHYLEDLAKEISPEEEAKIKEKLGSLGYI